MECYSSKWDQVPEFPTPEELGRLGSWITVKSGPFWGEMGHAVFPSAGFTTGDADGVQIWGRERRRTLPTAGSWTLSSSIPPNLVPNPTETPALMESSELTQWAKESLEVNRSSVSSRKLMVNFLVGLSLSLSLSLSLLDVLSFYFNQITIIHFLSFSLIFLLFPWINSRS